MKPGPGKFYAELQNILEFWSTVAYNADTDSFYGRIDNFNEPEGHADLGSVLYSRILWSFSAGFRVTGTAKYLEMARKSFEWLGSFFWDDIHQGVYWTIRPDGKPSNPKKQVYAQAFAIYGLTEFYAASQDPAALDLAIKLFNLIEKYSYDPDQKGYFEAFGRDWTETADLRLSAKDSNEKKTMNTHLHVLEAYSNLYKVWPDAILKARLEELLRVFRHRILDKRTGHLILFHNEFWTPRSETISYGHDIEASWLLREAAETIGDVPLIKEFEQLSLVLVNAAMEGIDNDGGLNYEYEPAEKLINREKHWWVQAEAAVGFLAAGDLTGEAKYMQYFNDTWSFIEKHILDKKYGEWFWGVFDDHAIMIKEDKAGLWKCPYHNSRCCIEILRLLQNTRAA